MKRIFTFSIIILLASSATAQEWIFTPKIGLHTMKHKIIFNNIPSYYPIPNESFLYGFKLNYQGKKGHGVYMSATAFNAGLNFSFMDPFNNQFKYSNTPSKITRLEFGYQWSSKPIYFKTLLDNNISSSAFNSMENKGWYFKLQPHLGAGLNINSGGSYFNKIDTNTTVFHRTPSFFTPSYALGIDIELGKNGNRRIILSAHYSHLIGNSFSTSIRSRSNGIQYETLAFSRPSWNFSIGVPITFKSKKYRIAPEKTKTAFTY